MMLTLVMATTVVLQDMRITVPPPGRMHSVEIQDEGDAYLVHFFVRADGMAGRRGVVSFRSLQRSTLGDKIHLSTKTFPIGQAVEVWEFFLMAPKFPELPDDAVYYQVEIGAEPVRPQYLGGPPDSYGIGLDLMDSETWKFRDGTLTTLRDAGEQLLVTKYMLSVIEGRLMLRTAPVAVVAPSKAAPLAMESDAPRSDSDPLAVEILARRVEAGRASGPILAASSSARLDRSVGVVDDLERPAEGDLTVHRYFPEEPSIIVSAPGIPSVPPANPVMMAPAKAAP